MTEAAKDGHLVYLYGIVPEGTPLPSGAEAGLGGAPVRLLSLGPVAAVVGTVDAADYGEAVLNERLGDIEWVGARGLEHEAVLQALAEETTVLPLRPFSLHAGEERIRERLGPQAPRLLSALDRLAGRSEWSVRLWRAGDRLRGALARHSDDIRALEAELTEASPGRRFLLGKKLEREVAEARRRVTREMARSVFAELDEAAERSVSLPVPSLDASRPDARTVVLRAAHLVPDAEADAFRARASVLGERWENEEFSLELTGPWPAYNFADTDDES